MIVREELKLKIYHGSTESVKYPNLDILNYKTDFGKGFYTTTDYEQAKKWSKIKKKWLENNSHGMKINSYVSVYDFVEKNDLKILRFESATKEWLDFIFKNRKSNDLLHEYDIVIGPVANDNLYQVISGYEDGIYNLNETIKRLKTYTLTNQISFHTAKALKCIKYMKTIKMGDGDKDE